MAGKQRYVVLGGGSGGLVAANKLGRELGEDHEVVLIDRRAHHHFMPSYLFLMTGQRQPDDIMGDLRRLERRNVRVMRSEVEGIDPDRSEIQLQDERLSYDKLVVSLGMQTRSELIPGLAEGSHHAWEMDAALRFRRELDTIERGRILIGVSPGPYRCPPAPYEVQWMIDAHLRQRGVRDDITIEFFTPSQEPRGDESEPAVWMDAQSKQRGIHQHYGFQLQEVDPEAKVARGLYGYELSYDLLFVVPPHRPSQVLIDSRIADSPAGVKVDFDTLQTRWDNVYAVGDCADLPASKAGGVAHQAADTVAHNLVVEATGRGVPGTLRLHTL
jgi:sulfide:quinone oxidoreductase